MNGQGPGQKVLVLGLGRFGGGREAVRFLHARGASVRIADKSKGPDLDESRAVLADLGDLDWQLGREDAGLLEDIGCVVVNPAVPDQHPLLVEAGRRAIPMTQEVNLFLDHYPGRVVAVTGTNGKSTTSMLLHAALEQAGLPALLGGNIGNSLLAESARWQAQQTAVLEISSFQLERIDLERHRVHGAVLTRIGRDHVDRHGTLAAYHAAKARLPAVAHGFFVHAADDPVAVACSSPAVRRVTFATEAPPSAARAGVDDGWLCTPAAAERERLLHQDALLLLGLFQRENVLAAAVAARLLGAEVHPVALAMATARPLPFRLQLARVVAGVRIYDNGVSTEIESTRSALRSLPGPVHWIGGGKSKDGDFQAVADGVLPFIASAHLFGAAALPLQQCLEGKVPVTRSERFPEAAVQALLQARPGDAVLWSPAFASFDQYPNFRARALEFQSWLAAGRSGGAPGPAQAEATGDSTAAGR